MNSAASGPVSNYREIAPPPALARYLVCLWWQRIDGIGREHVQEVLPDGCADIVRIGDERLIVAGPATIPVRVPLPAGTEVVGARLRPGFVPALLRVAADELRNHDTPLVDLWGTAGDRLGERLGAQPDLAARLKVFGHDLVERFVAAEAADPVVTTIANWLGRNPAGRIRDAAERAGISERHLQRRFSVAVGYGPKTFQRIVRFQRALADATAGDGLAGLAARAGYADQAHMSREIRRLSGQPAAALLARTGSTLGLSDLFKTDGRGEG